MDKNKKKKRKMVKIGRYNVKLSRLIDVIVTLILLTIILLSPKEALIVTQKYNQGTEEQNNSVKIALGEENTEEKFNLYFQWFNVLHEVGHGLIHYNSNIKVSEPEEEQLVNNFAYAYWDYYGEHEKLDQVEEIINYAYDHIQNEEGRSMNYMEYAKKHWNDNKFYTFNNYGYFQFSCGKETFKNKKDLKTVLKEMGITNADLSNIKTLNYETINKDVCNQILEDAVNNIHDWGLKYPNVVHKYTKNPYYSYFAPRKKIINDIILLFDKSLSD